MYRENKLPQRGDKLYIHSLPKTPQLSQMKKNGKRNLKILEKII